MALALSVGLLPPLTGCDAEPVDEAELELAEQHRREIQAELELTHDVQLEPIVLDESDESLELDADSELAHFGFTEASEYAPHPAEGACGLGYWEWDIRNLGCDACDVSPTERGQKFERYKRWCWDGPPSCGGCGGWQYISWSCSTGCLQ